MTQEIHVGPSLAVDSLKMCSLGRTLDPRDPQLIHQTASQMVSELFFGPMLAQMRQFPFGQELGGGGRGEQVFGEQLDRKLAEATSRGQGGPLVRQLETRLKNHTAVELRAKLAAQRKLAEVRFGGSK